MLSRIATHADVLGAAEPSVRHELIQTLCQPFFKQTVDSLWGEISSVGPVQVDTTWQNIIMNHPLKDDRFGKSLGLAEEDSTDADNDSAFATLFTSDGEDCEAEPRMEKVSQSSQFSSTVGAFDGDSESPSDEKSHMVCRHWKSKGWCRYESQCKFSHPESKRGASANALMENSDRPARRRGGKNRRTVIALDSRLLFADSYNVCVPSTLCQVVQQHQLV
jgi:hypothetical protein